MAQISSSSHQTLNIFQDWLFHHPFLAFSGISFIIGVILSLQPAFIDPVGKRIVIDHHDFAIDSSLVISSFCLCVFFFSVININFDIFWLVYLWIALFLLFFGSVIYLVERQLIKFLTRSKRQSLRPLSCIHCRKKLTMLNSPINFLTHQEITAMNIKSKTFEAWNCQNCYPEINLQSTHLRIYQNTSDRFKECPVCQEITMKKSSKILQEATTTQEGKELITYTCHCCHKKEETIKITPQKEVHSCSGCAGCA
jgi:hypothetical protein